MSEVYYKTVRGVGWSFADNLATQGVTFLVGLMLTRLLTPEEYGFIGIVTIFIPLFNSIVDSGSSNALIRKNLPEVGNNKEVHRCYMTLPPIEKRHPHYSLVKFV